MREKGKERTVTLLRQLESVSSQVLPAVSDARLVRLRRPVIPSTSEELREGLIREGSREDVFGGATGVGGDTLEGEGFGGELFLL